MPTRAVRITFAALATGALLVPQAIVAKRGIESLLSQFEALRSSLEIGLLVHQAIIAWIVIDTVFLRVARALFPKEFRREPE